MDRVHLERYYRRFEMRRNPSTSRRPGPLWIRDYRTTAVNTAAGKQKRIAVAAACLRSAAYGNADLRLAQSRRRQSYR